MLSLNAMFSAMLITAVCTGGAASAQTTRPQPRDAIEAAPTPPEWKAPQIQPTFSIDVDCWVSRLSTTKAGLGDDITVTVLNPDAYIQWARQQKKELAATRTVTNLVLFLDGRPIAGNLASKMNPYTTQAAIHVNGPTFTMAAYDLTFQLIRSSKNNAAWAELLNRPNASGREVTVSVGFEDLTPVSSNIQKTSDSPDTAHFELVVVPFDAWMMCGIVLIAATLGMFFKLASSTTLLRDPQAPLKPDNRRPFSLARIQMAFWFFLVFATYFIIWAITGDKDTIPGSVLGLIGISAATAISSSVVDFNRGDADDTTRNVRLETLKGGRREKLKATKEMEAKVEEELKSATKDVATKRNDPNALSGQTLEDLQKAVADKGAELEQVQAARRYFSRDPWQVFLYDILSDQDAISFSRFQIIVWTLLLGIIFLKEVYMHLAMPEFSPYLLGLMGISAGTFLGLKATTKPAS